MRVSISRFALCLLLIVAALPVCSMVGCQAEQQTVDEVDIKKLQEQQRARGQRELSET